MPLLHAGDLLSVLRLELGVSGNCFGGLVGLRAQVKGFGVWASVFGMEETKRHPPERPEAAGQPREGVEALDNQFSDRRIHCTSIQSWRTM